ncbi:MAG: 16S rRNA (uracil(1498)-N(3))-methyltransferase [Cytophagales bacterium]|nr:16S rRNA (uracil(1498)-N(3))-methyltransferase [Cytophagales bacterium]MDW8383995.1 RsmE family RNA methyltransferase [Flammeovirgaceae bacterium]
MSLPIFYDKHLDSIAQEWNLPEEESYHLVKVLRACKGELIEITNGKGLVRKAIFSHQHKKQAVVHLTETRHESLRLFYYLHIGVAPTKNIDRIEWFLEKATEIGINQITFLKTEHSLRKDVPIDRLERIAVAAMKQSQQYHIPVIKGITPFSEFVSQQDSKVQKFICELCEQPVEMLCDAANVQNPICVAIGPEGGFSKQELSHAQQHGFRLVSLTSSRLRTETAALYVVNAINALAHCANLSRSKLGIPVN